MSTKKSKQFGEQVAGYTIPVLNEREIRAGAGILFLFMFIAITRAITLENFTMLKYMVSIFLVDFIIRIFVSPKHAPILILARYIVRKQTPEYVGAEQKKFAWIIGLVLSFTIFILLSVMNTLSIITGLICLICLVFLFFETAFGICIGCKMYGLFKKEKAQYCPGEVCEVKDRHEIQKISKGQFFIVLGFVVFIVLLIFLMKDFFAETPTNLMDLL
ncbi:MAG: hypothetical protein COB98_09865 [Flavobacteriaceae bacterium]|nr:MAG: hypothetical protein COB98_09865 [Flavobacteriaceae bacterium]